MDFIDLNATYPKEPYPFSNIDRLIDGLSCYLRYNQIKMDLVDPSNMEFMSNHGNYYYNVIPFILKNVGSTYK